MYVFYRYYEKWWNIHTSPKIGWPYSSGLVKITPQFSEMWKCSCHFHQLLMSDSLSSAVSLLPSPHLPYLLIPGIIVLVRVAADHLQTVSPVFRLASVGLRNSVQSQFSVDPCSLGGCWAQLPVVTPPVNPIQANSRATGFTANWAMS